MAPSSDHFLLSKIGNPRPLFIYFRSFQASITKSIKNYNHPVSGAGIQTRSISAKRLFRNHCIKTLAPTALEVTIYLMLPTYCRGQCSSSFT